MAALEQGEIVVAVEAAVHEAIRAVVEHVEQQHGLRISSIYINEWINASSVTKQKFVPGPITITTTSD